MKKPLLQWHWLKKGMAVGNCGSYWILFSSAMSRRSIAATAEEAASNLASSVFS
jgi:hypothetical protein